MSTATPGTSTMTERLDWVESWRPPPGVYVWCDVDLPRRVVVARLLRCGEPLRSVELYATVDCRLCAWYLLDAACDPFRLVLETAGWEFERGMEAVGTRGRAPEG